jgi:hypothetical protein
MSDRTLFFLTCAVILGMGVIFVINIMPIMEPHPSERYLSFNHVRGMAVVHNQKEYTLNFEQQNTVIDLINRSIPTAEKLSKSPSPFPFSRLIIYLFNAPNVEITPLESIDNNLIFSAPAWNVQGQMKDLSNGDLKKLLMQTYGP